MHWGSKPHKPLRETHNIWFGNWIDMGTSYNRPYTAREYTYQTLQGDRETDGGRTREKCRDTHRRRRREKEREAPQRVSLMTFNAVWLGCGFVAGAVRDAEQ